jgi:hypothetical protein
MEPENVVNLLEAMREVVRQGIGRDSGYGVLAGAPERIRRAVITLLYQRRQRQHDRFQRVVVYGHRQVDEGAASRSRMIDPGYRAKGLSRVLHGLTCMLVLCARG